MADESKDLNHFLFENLCAIDVILRSVGNFVHTLVSNMFGHLYAGK